ncbi:MAG: FtsX-like permease family protein [Tissierellia bacterium]|nr:FtsX-like permease family protein [Tissierellia bacterium]
MKKRAMTKDILREIRKTWTRFLSILIMTAIGVFVFVGLKVTGPQMRHTATDYATRQKMYDVIVTAPLGLDEKDMAILEETPGIEKGEAGYFTDVSFKEKKISIRLESFSKEISTPTLVEGRYPEKEGEILLEQTPSTEDIAIGDTIHFEIEKDKFKKDKDHRDLKSYSYVVVGKSMTTDYVVQGFKGVSPIAASTLDTVGFISKDNFSKEEYSFYKIRVKETQGLNPDRRKYKAITSTVKDDLIERLKPRSKDKFIEIKDELRQTIADAEADIQDAKEQLVDGRKKLDDAKRELVDARNELDDGLQELTDKEAEGRAEIAKSEKELADARQKLLDGKDTLAKEKATFLEKEEEFLNQKKELEGQRANFDTQKEEFEAGKQKLDAGIQEAEAGLQQITGGIEELEAALAKLSAMGMTDDKLTAQLEGLRHQQNEIEGTLGQLRAKKKELLAKGEELLEAEKMLETAEAKIKEGETSLEEGRSAIAKAEEEIAANEKKILDGENKLFDARRTLNQEIAKARQELRDGEADYEEGMATLQKEERTYEKEKKDAEEKIADGEEDLRDARDVLGRLKKPKYDVDTRKDNEFLYYLYESGHKLDKISGIFPVFFFFIAILVSVTTMTRMVEERRVQIGTYKALGYGIGDIFKKYLMYGLCSSLLGGILGATLGSVMLPKIIYHAYAASFTIKQMTGISDPLTNIGAILLGVGANLIAIFLVIRRSLKENAAALMRPKSPKKAKAILLEKIQWIWNRVSFLGKVTLRNVFRYKSRMFMTIFGIAGCTGLLFLGFGLKESISQLKPLQYEGIFKYDLQFMTDDFLGDEGVKDYESILLSEDVKSFGKAHTEILKYIQVEGADQPVNLVVPEEPEHFTEYIDFTKQRLLKKDLHYPLDRTSITPKLARLLGRNNQKISLLDGDLHEYHFVYDRVVDFYQGHYLFMTPENYENATGKAYNTNTYYIRLADGVDPEVIKEKLLDNPSVLAVTDFSNHEKIISDWMSSINMVVLIIIICSAILAFVVLYNLSNINISERIRELSTIKVLGFNSLEITQYVFREIYLLSFMGILFGYGVGWFLFIMVAEVLPPDDFMLNTLLSYQPYLFSALISLFFTFVVRFLVAHRLKRIDMVEALKSYE